MKDKEIVARFIAGYIVVCVAAIIAVVTVRLLLWIWP